MLCTYFNKARCFWKVKRETLEQVDKILARHYIVVSCSQLIAGVHLCTCWRCYFFSLFNFIHSLVVLVVAYDTHVCVRLCEYTFCAHIWAHIRRSKWEPDCSIVCLPVIYLTLFLHFLLMNANWKLCNRETGDFCIAAPLPVPCRRSRDAPTLRLTLSERHHYTPTSRRCCGGATTARHSLYTIIIRLLSCLSAAARSV